MGASELLGVALGGVIAGCGALIGHVYSQRSTHRQWLRDSRLAAQSTFLTAAEAGYIVALHNNNKERAASVTMIRGAYAKVVLLGPADVGIAAASMTEKLLGLMLTEDDPQKITQETVVGYNRSRDAFCSVAYRHISQPVRPSRWPRGHKASHGAAIDAQQPADR